MGAEGADRGGERRRSDGAAVAPRRRGRPRPRRFHADHHGKGRDEGARTPYSTAAAAERGTSGPTGRPVAAAAAPSSDGPRAAGGPPSAGGNDHAEPEPTGRPAHGHSDASDPTKRTRPQLRMYPDRTSTSYSIFSSNPNRFIKEQIYGATHFLTDGIEGRVWLDVDGDGRRDDADRRLGIGGVKVLLVDCGTDRPVASASMSFENFVANAENSVTSPADELENPVASLPRSPYGGNPIASRGEDPSAGLYSFPIGRVPSGRYYLMYTAPRDYRISGNVLPLDRNAPFFDCLPAGGEGGVYLSKARRYGDFDLSGYCARSIGCFEVDRRMSVHEKSNFDDYDDLDVLGGNPALEDRLTGGYAAYIGSLAAVPFAEYFDVGLAQEEWELPTYQYADLEVTFTFPQFVDPRSVAPEEFEMSPARAALEEGLEQFLGGVVVGGEDGFEIGGVDVHTATANLERNLERKTQEDLNQVTYTLTVGGHYRPPPNQQLGSVVEDSINRDPQKLALSLKDREPLPDVVAQDVEAKWLTMKENPETAIEPGPDIIDAGGFVFMGSWAFVLVASLAGLLILLCIGMCLCLCQRARAIRSASEHPPRTEGRKEARKGVKLVGSMNTADILQELESHGITASNAMSRTKLEDELIQARFDASYSRRKKEVMFIPPTTPDEGGETPAEIKPPVEPKGGKPRGFFRFLRLSSIDEEEESQRREVRLVESMSIREIRDELESYGVSPPGVLEGRKKLEEELIQARFDNVYSRNGPEKRKKVTFSFTTIFSSVSSVNSKDTIKTNPPMMLGAAAQAVQRDFEEHEKTEEERRRQLDEAMRDCESLKVWELRRMLKSMGVSSVGFVEKKELVRAVAEARVNRTKAGTTEKDVKAQRHSLSQGRGRMHTWGARLGKRKGDKISGPNIAQPGAHEQRRQSSPGPAPILRPKRREKSKPRESGRRRSCPGPSSDMHTLGGVDHSSPQPRSRSAQPYRCTYAEEECPLSPKENHYGEPMRPHSRSTHQPRRPEQIHRASARTQPRSDERRSSPAKSSRHQGARERDPDRYARRRRRHEERDARAQAPARTQATPQARTRSAEERRDGSCRPRPEESCTSRSCPTSTYAGGWDEAAYYSQFHRPGGQRKDDKTDRSRSAPKPYSEERNARAEACPKARRRSEEHPLARKRSGERRGKRRPGGDPRGKDSRRDRSGRRACRPSCKIDSLFGDGYSFQIV